MYVLAIVMCVCFHGFFQIKKLKATKKYQVKKAQVLSEEKEDCLCVCEKGLLGDM